jgi:hypothetical protein
MRCAGTEIRGISLGKVIENYNLHIAAQVVHMVAAYFNLDVEVHLTVGNLGDSWAESICYCEGFGEIEFDRELIRNASRNEIITVTAHEMVHIKQYEYDGLMLSEKAAYFKGKSGRENIGSPPGK